MMCQVRLLMVKYGGLTCSLTVPENDAEFVNLYNSKYASDCVLAPEGVYTLGSAVIEKGQRSATLQVQLDALHAIEGLEQVKIYKPAYAVEYDYLAAVPNFDFMEEQFTKDTDKFDRTVIVMHAAPYSDQFNNNVCKAFRRYLDFAPGLMCCIYGHDHNDTVSDIYHDGLMFYAIDCAKNRNYRIMTIKKDGYEIEQIRY